MTIYICRQLHQPPKAMLAGILLSIAVPLPREIPLPCWDVLGPSRLV